MLSFAPSFRTTHSILLDFPASAKRSARRRFHPVISSFENDLSDSLAQHIAFPDANKACLISADGGLCTTHVERHPHIQHHRKSADDTASVRIDAAAVR